MESTHVALRSVPLPTHQLAKRQAASGGGAHTQSEDHAELLRRLAAIEEQALAI